MPEIPAPTISTSSVFASICFTCRLAPRMASPLHRRRQQKERGRGMAGHGSNRVILTALAANVGIAVAKFVAAGITGSSAMITEGVHSLVDSTNHVLLLYGGARARKQPDARHPLGYGREPYFWSFVVAMLVFL